MIYHEDEAEFYGDACSVIGVAVWDVTIEDDFNADIGGVDGLTVTGVDLLHVDLDGYHLPAAAIAHIMGDAAMVRAKDVIAETIQENIGDYAMAAE